MPPAPAPLAVSVAESPEQIVLPVAEVETVTVGLGLILTATVTGVQVQVPFTTVTVHVVGLEDGVAVVVSELGFNKPVVLVHEYVSPGLPPVAVNTVDWPAHTVLVAAEAVITGGAGELIVTLAVPVQLLASVTVTV